MVSAVETAEIVCTPGTMGGAPRIDGRRVRVMDILLKWNEIPDAVRLAGSYVPPLTVEQVEAAMAYYRSHRHDVELAIAEEKALYWRFVADEMAKGR